MRELGDGEGRGCLILWVGRAWGCLGAALADGPGPR